MGRNIVGINCLRMDTGNKNSEAGKTHSRELHPEGWLDGFNLSYLGLENDRWCSIYEGSRYWGRVMALYTSAY